MLEMNAASEVRQLPSLVTEFSSSTPPTNWETLKDAVEQGNQKQVQRYIDETGEPVTTIQFMELFELAQRDNNLGMKKALTQLPGFEVNAAHPPSAPTLLVKTALLGDLDFTRYLLQQGADPSKVAGNFDIKSIPIHTLLSQAKIINTLYLKVQDSSRQKIGHTRQHAIDVALKEYDVEKAKHIIKTIRTRLDLPLQEFKSDFGLWQHAIAFAKLEILRAMLVFCSPQIIKKLIDQIHMQDIRDIRDPLLRTYIEQYDPDKHETTIAVTTLPKAWSPGLRSDFTERRTTSSMATKKLKQNGAPSPDGQPTNESQHDNESGMCEKNVALAKFFFQSLSDRKPPDKSLPYQAMLQLTEKTLARISRSTKTEFSHKEISDIAYDFYAKRHQTENGELTLPEQKVPLTGLEDRECADIAATTILLHRTGKPLEEALLSVLKSKDIH